MTSIDKSIFVISFVAMAMATKHSLLHYHNHTNLICCIIISKHVYLCLRWFLGVLIGMCVCDVCALDHFGCFNLEFHH